MKHRDTRLRTFHQLLGNTIVTTITHMTVWFALIFFVYLETTSVTATSIVSGLYLIAVAASGFWFGSLVDRYKKKNVMIASGLISLLIYTLAFVTYITAPDGAFGDPTRVALWVFVLLLLTGVISGNIRGIALPTLITLLIPEERRDKANGLAGTASGVALLITSAISGLLVGRAGMVWVLVLTLAMMVASTIHLITIPIPENDIARPSGDAAKLDIRGTMSTISTIPGLMALIFFTTLNNLLGGVFMGLMDAYGLSLVSVEAWGILWAVISCGFIVGGLVIARRGLGKNPLWALFAANICIWAISSVFTVRPSIALLATGTFIYMCVVPFIEAAEHTIMQKVVPAERQGRVFGFAQSVEQAASPVMTLAIGPIAELVFIPFMTVGAGADLIGGWFGTGADRGIALVFILTGIVGLLVTVIAMNTKYYSLLSNQYGAGTRQEMDNEEHRRDVTPTPYLRQGECLEGC